MRKITLLAFLLVYCNIGLWAQDKHYQFSQLDITNGLSNNQINCIFKDSKGFIWFGTMAGLNRYDGYAFKIFKHRVHDSLSLIDDYVTQIFDAPGNKVLVQTRNGFSIYDPAIEGFISREAYCKTYNLPVYGVITSIVKCADIYWFIYNNGGMYKVSQKGTEILKPFVYTPNPNNEDVITDAKKDVKGNLVLIYGNGTLVKMDPVSNKIIFRSDVISKILQSKTNLFSIFIDKDDNILVYAPIITFGVVYYNVEKGTVKLLSKENHLLTSSIITSIIEDNGNNFWIGTNHGGINVINKKTFTGFAINNQEGNNKSVAENAIYTLFKDELGIVWVGTFKKGISYYADNIIKFPLFTHNASEPGSLSFDDVNKFAEDDKGNIWIGSNGGGLIYFNRQSNTFKAYKHDPSNKNSISNDVIVSLCIDHEKKLWIGSYYGGLDCYDGKTFTHYKHNGADTNSLVDDKVWQIYEDKDRNLWIGTLGGGLDRFDRSKKIFYHYNTSTPNSVHSNYITSFLENGNELWIGTAYGIDVLQKKTGVFTHYSSTDNMLSNDNTYSIIKDSYQNIWVGTREGLNVLNRQTHKFQSFRTEEGLPDNAILNILEDKDHNLWVSTPNGIAKIAIKKKGDSLAIISKNYDGHDGLQGNVFNENAALKTRDGHLLFGGSHGFNIFEPGSINENKHVPSIVFTGLQVFNKPVYAGQKINGHVILSQSISQVQQIILNHDDNVFSVEFAVLDFAGSEKIKYAYKLEGFNTGWLLSGGNTRSVTYTNLDAGDYFLHIKASNGDGVWDEKGVVLKIVVLPPFWQTTWAYIVYALIIAGVLFLARRMVIQRANMRFAIEHERKEAQRMHELDMMKMRFFTNVSHDFKTPLSLILAPLDKLIKNADKASQKHQFQMIHRNARRLLHFVNQLLDIRKMETQELKLYPSKGDIIKFIKNTSYSFTDLAEKSNITFSCTSSIEHFFTEFDHDKLERILFNLLSNSFKFTGEGGSVTVEICVAQVENKDMMQIKVADTGIGIPAEKYERIFDYFFQDDITGKMASQGSGLGLSIVKEFVRLHNGHIHVESKVNNGSCFTLQLPFTRLEVTAPEINSIDDGLGDEEIIENTILNGSPQINTQNGADSNHSAKKPVVLIVEDSDDLRYYLKDNLAQYFNIVEANNGKNGWQKALSSHPDLIISDINMPEMKGDEFCRKLKNDKRTSFIPIILLTALVGEEQQLKALETGANDYMTKPFNFEILLSKIKNLLKLQETSRRTYQKQLKPDAADVQVEAPDEKFMHQLLEILEKNIANPEFLVEDMSRELHISRVGLYKKMLLLTGKAPLEFIRVFRLERSAQLLEKSKLTIAEIAYEVGFNDPKYFSKLFKTEFGILPSEYLAGKREKQMDTEAISEKK